MEHTKLPHTISIEDILDDYLDSYPNIKYKIIPLQFDFIEIELSFSIFKHNLPTLVSDVIENFSTTMVQYRERLGPKVIFEISKNNVLQRIHKMTDFSLMYFDFWTHPLDSTHRVKLCLTTRNK